MNQTLLQFSQMQEASGPNLETFFKALIVGHMMKHGEDYLFHSVIEL